MNNDYNSSTDLPMGKGLTPRLKSVHSSTSAFTFNSMRFSVKLLLLFLIGSATHYEGYSQAVINNPSAAISVCENGTPIILTGGPALSGNQKARWTVVSSTGGAIPSEVLTEPSFNDVTATFNPDSSGVASGNSITFELKFTLDEDGDFDPGEGDTTFATTFVTVNAAPVAVATAASVDVCENGGNVLLTGSPSVGNGVGQWSGATGITNTINSNNAQFDPRGHDGIVPLIYTFTDGNSCPAKDTVNILVHNPAILAPIPNLSVCSNSDTIDLQGFPFRDSVQTFVDSINSLNNAGTTATVGTGVWSGIGLLALSSTDSAMGTGKFVPTGLNGQITLTYTYTAGSACTESITTRINVFEAPSVDGGTYGPFCESINPILLDQGNQVQGGGSMGTWDTVSYKNTGGMVAEVNNDVLSSINPTAGTATFEPTNGAGEYILSYTFIDINGCEIIDTIAPIVVNANPVAMITSPVTNSDTFTVCAKDTLINLIGMPDPSGSGGTGTWTGTGVVDTDVNDNDATFNPITAGTGTHTLIYEYLNINGCSDTAAIFIHINALPTVSTDGPYSTCRDGNMMTPTNLKGTPASDNGVWSGKGIVNGSNGEAIFEPDSASVNGLTVVTLQYKYTDAHGCSDSTTTTVNITTPTVTTTANQIFCAGESIFIPLSGAGTSFEYILTGDAVGLSDGTGNSLAGILTNTSTDTLTATVEVIPSISGCEGERDTFNILVKPLPTVDARVDTTVCAESMTNLITFSGTDLNPEATSFIWNNDNIGIGLTGSGTGVGVGIGNIPAFIATNTSSSVITANIVVTPTAAGCTGDTTSFKINVNPLPTINVPNDTTYCEGETTTQIDLTGSTGATLSWTLSGDDVGLLANNMANVPSFVAENATSMPDTAKIVIFAEENGCQVEATDTLFIVVNPETDIPALAMNPLSLNPFCSTGDTIHLDFNRTGAMTPNSGSTPYAQLGVWKTPTTGISNPNPTMGTAVFDPTGLDGNIELSYTFINEYSCSSEELLTINVENANPIPGTYADACSEGGNVPLAGQNTLTNTQTGFWTVKDDQGVIVNALIATATDTLAGTANFNPSGLRGTYTLIYTIKNLQNNCESRDSTTINIGSTVIDLGVYNPVCSNDSLVQLIAAATSGGTISTGEWGLADTFNVAVTSSPISKLTELTADLDPSGLVGYYKLYFKYTNAAGCMDIDTLPSFFIVNEAPSVTVPLDQEVCQDAAAFNLVGSRTPIGANGELAKWGPENIIIDPNVMDASITFDPALFTDDVTLTYTFTDGKGCIGIDSVDIKINQLPTVEAGTNLTLDNGVLEVCETNSVINVEATPIPGTNTFGSWTPSVSITDTNINDEKADFDPSGKNGPYNLTYTFTDANNCVNSSTITIDVRPLPTVFAGNNQTICEDAGIITLIGASPDPLIANGTGVWSGSTGLDAGDNTGDNQISFNPTGLASTIPINIKYTYTDEIGCMAVDSLALTVNAPPTVNAGTYGPQCQNAMLNLAGTPNPNAAGNIGNSSWSLNNTVITSNSNAGTATVDLSSLTAPITVVYSYTDGNGCTGTDTTTIEIQAITASIDDADGAVCKNGNTIMLTGSPIPQTGETGTWSGNGVYDLSAGDAVAVFEPTDPTVNTGSVTLTYTFVDTAGCTNSADTVINVNSLPSVTVGSGFDPICVSSNPIEFSGGPVPSGTTTATWNGDGITNTTDGKAMFDPSGLSDTIALTFTYTDANSCASSKDTFIIVNDLPTLDLGGPYGPICQNEEELRIAANTAHADGQIGVWSGMGAKDTLNTDSIAYFDPSGLTGIIKLTYTYTDTSGCTASATEDIMINDLPIVDAGNYNDVCINAGMMDLLGSPAPTGSATGSWTTTSAGLTDISPMDAVATFDPMAAGIGSHNLTYTFTDENGCMDSMITNITVVNIPSVVLVGAGVADGDLICEGSDNIQLTGSPIPSTGESGTWSGSGITQYNALNATATFSPSGLNGAIELIYTFLDDTGCMAADTLEIAVENLMANAGVDQTICESNGLLELGGNPKPIGDSTGTWSGAGVMDNSVMDSIGMFDPTGLSGAITLYYEVKDTGTGCESIDSVIITVTSNIVTATTPNDTICKEAMPITLTGNPAPGIGETGKWIQDSIWITDSSDGDAVAIFHPSLVSGPYPRPVYALYEYSDANGCTNIDSTEIVVYELPIVNAGTDMDLCEESNAITIIGSPTPTATGSTGTWSGTGISDNGDGSASFDPTGLTDSIMAIYTYQDRLGCVASDTTIMKINNTILDIGTYGPVCMNETAILLETVTALTTGTGIWSGTGVTDSTSITNGIRQGSFNPSTAGYGTHNLIFTYTNNGGCLSADTTTITVNQPIIGPFADICTDNGLVTLTGSPLPSTGQTGIWEINGVAQSGDTDGVYDLNPSSLSGLVALEYKIEGNGCSDSVASTIMVNALPTVDAGSDQDICESDAPIMLSGSTIPSGGTGIWTGNGISDADVTDRFAFFNPANLSGATRLIYTVKNVAGCTNQDTVYITVTDLAVDIINQTAVCKNADPITLVGAPSNGTWSGIGITDGGNGTAQFDPEDSAVLGNVVIVSYTVNSSGCAETANTTITIFDAQVSAATIPSPLCQSDAPFTITGTPIPSGGAIGTWTGPGLTNINAATGTATFNPASVNGSTTLIYTFTANGCTESATTIVNVNQSATASLTIDQSQICEGGSIQLNATTTNAAGVTWATSGIGSFSPATGNSTTYTPSGTVSGSNRTDEISAIAVASSGNCPVAIATTNLQIIKPATVDLGQDISFCESTSGTLTPVSLGTGNTISWSASNGTFSDNIALNTTYTANALTGNVRTDVITITSADAFNICPTATDQLNVTLVNPIEITEGETGAICEGDTIVVTANYAGGASGFTSQVNNNKGIVIIHDSQIKYVPKANSDLVIRKDTVIIINPDLDGTGDCIAFRDTMIVDVSPKATVELIADTAICSEESINLIANVTGDFAAFSSSLNLSTSVTNYAPTITGATVMDKVLYSTQLPGSICPAALDSVEITITSLSETSLNLIDTTICAVNSVELTAGVTGGIYNWAVLGNAGTLNNNTLENPIYTPGNSTFTGSRMDTLILNLTSSTDKCNTGIDTLVVTVLEVGSFTPVPDTLVCSNNTIAIDVPISGSYDQFTWVSPNGTFSTTTDTNTVYTPTVITSGSRLDTVVASIQFTANACPAVMDTTIITVLAGVEINAGIDATVCEGLGVQLTGTLAGGATSGTWQVVGGFGTFDDVTAMNAVYTPNPVVNTTRIDALVLTSNDPDGTGGCTASTDTVLITVTPEATVSLGQDLTVLNGQSITLTATLSEPVISSQWSSALGTLSNSGLDQTIFTPLDLGTASSRVDQVIYEGFFTNRNCGSAMDTILITVNAPQAISKVEDNDFCGSLCLDEVTVNIDANTGTAVVLANNINPADTCGINDQFGFKFWNPSMEMAEPNTIIDVPNLPSSITFDCDDRGQQAVNVYVSDADMNTQLCPVNITIEDASIFCGERTIAGKITNTAGDPVIGFDVFLEQISEVGGVVPSVKTDENGAYSFTIDTDKKYRVTPRRDIDIAEGVTAFDNVIISRHILGLQPFTTPYQTIAADVNKSGTVTAFDIVVIRKVVLARDGEFDNNTSWRFVDANYQFGNILDAASAPFPESFVVTETMGNIPNMDFIAVKIGDVSGATPDGLVGNAESRNDHASIIFETTNQQIESGKIYEVPFRLLDAAQVKSYQFTLDFEGLELVNIKSGVVNKAHFGTTLTERSLLMTCWSTANPVEQGNEWFTLQFKATKNGRLSELLSLNSTITPIEAYTTDDANIGIELTFKQPVATTFDLFQNKPNPFKNETVIGFALPSASKAKITILDMQGKIVKTIESNYASGYNEAIIDMTNLSRGVFYYRLETSFGTKIQKMMHIE